MVPVGHDIREDIVRHSQEWEKHVHNLLGWVRLPAPQLRALSTKKDPKLGSFFVLRPHRVGAKHISAEHNDPNTFFYQPHEGGVSRSDT